MRLMPLTSAFSSLPGLTLETNMILTTDGWKFNEINPVEYIDHMGSDNAVCDAARVSFWKQAENYDDASNKKLLKYLAKHDHWSPFAHTSIKFRFKAPMFVARQFQKHVVGFAWNEVSRRYVDSDPTFFVPRTFRKRPDNMKQGSVAEGEVEVIGPVMDEVREQYIEASLNYKALLSRGVCPEQARMFLPQATMTEWIWTGSLMAWNRFIKLRADEHAQAECWGYAWEVKRHLTNLFPHSMEAFNDC